MERNLAGEDGRHTLRVQQKTWEADGITSVTLVDPSGAALPTWKPGAHLALVHAQGAAVAAVIDEALARQSEGEMRAPVAQVCA